MNGEVYSTSDFSNLPEVGRRAAGAQPLPDGDIGRMAQRAWARIGGALLPLVVEQISDARPPKSHGDRSEPQYFIEQSLREAGATREECYAIVKVQLRWNKFDDDRLWEELGRVYGDEEVEWDEPDLDPEELEHIPPRDWLYASHYIKNYATCTVSPGGVGKTALAMVEALAMATGKPLLGYTPWTKLKVWYVGEDDRPELLRRFRAVMLHYGITPDEWRGRLIVTSMRDKKLVVVEKTRSGAKIVHPVVASIERMLRSKSIDVVIVDPFVKTHEVDENDNKSVDTVASVWNDTASRCHVAIELPHHTRKLNGEAATEDSGRGGSAMRDALKSNRIVQVMTESEQGESKVDNRYRYFRTWFGKPNMIPRPETCDWYHLSSVGIGNATAEREEDIVQAVERWTFPQPGVGALHPRIKALQKAMGDRAWGYDHRSTDWVGRLAEDVAGVTIPVLDEWIEAGYFVRTRERTSSRHWRDTVRVGRLVNGGIIIKFPDRRQDQASRARVRYCAGGARRATTRIATCEPPAGE
jgi:hypothetical protein